MGLESKVTQNRALSISRYVSLYIKHANLNSLIYLLN
jgi:hypothetical protein